MGISDQDFAEVDKKFSIYEKSDVVRAVSDIIEKPNVSISTPRILLKGGPGVGKSTASYEALEYLKSIGKKTVWLQIEKFGTESTRERIKEMGPDTVLFIDSLDAVLSDTSDNKELSTTVNLLNELGKDGLGPIVLANIHDPYLVPKRQEEDHKVKRDLVLGERGLFTDLNHHVVVKDECVDENSQEVALKKYMKDGGIHESWFAFMKTELKSKGINTHSIISNLFSETSLSMKGETLPDQFKSEFVESNNEHIKTWLDQFISKVNSQNEDYKRAYYHPESEEEAWKGLVRHDV